MMVDSRPEDTPAADGKQMTPSVSGLAGKPKHEKIDRITALQDGIGKLPMIFFPPSS